MIRLASILCVLACACGFDRGGPDGPISGADARRTDAPPSIDAPRSIDANTTDAFVGVDSGPDASSFVCGGGIDVIWAEAGQEFVGTTVGGDNKIMQPCVSASTGPEDVYAVLLTGPGQLIASTDFFETSIDLTLYVVSSCDNLPSSLLECNDDGVGDSLFVNFENNILFPITVYVVVDSHTPVLTGNYRLAIQFIPES